MAYIWGEGQEIGGASAGGAVLASWKLIYLYQI